MEDLVATLILLAAASSMGPEERPGELRRAEAFVEAHLDRPLTVAEIADAAGTPRHTLFRTFRRIHGRGPTAWARDRRLHAVHHALIAADPSETTVTEVALRFGFTHAGRFAGEYRRAHGELPSETLRG